MTERRSRAAALLDRDGTIIVDREYTNDPANVQLLPEAAQAIRVLAANGYPAIVVTNQSGIARGIITLEQYRAVRARLNELLTAEGATLADTFTCPHHPDIDGPCGCRKPGLELYERAAVLYDLDLAKCLFVGDRMRDIAAAVAFGGRGALVKSPYSEESDITFAIGHSIPVVESLADAVSLLVTRREAQ